MKKFIISTLILIGFGCNKNLDPAQVPDPVINAFYSDFPTDVKVKWEETKDKLYEANFEYRGQLREILYDSSGVIVKVNS
jgi:hypothetical protein